MERLVGFLRNKLLNRFRWISYLKVGASCFLFLSGHLSFSADLDIENTKSEFIKSKILEEHIVEEPPKVLNAKNKVFPNRGFIKKLPLSLKERFPACEEFLDVTWIDEENRIGYANYDIYSLGRYIDRFIGFVYLHSHRSTYNLNVYVIGSNKELSSNVRYMNKERKKLRDGYPYTLPGERLVKDNFDTLIKLMKELKKEDYPMPFGDRTNDFVWAFNSSLNYTGAMSLSGFTKNVCVAYPDSSRVWFAEVKSIDNILEVLEVDEIYKRVAPIIYPNQYDQINPVSRQMARDAFNNTSAIDLNYDGKLDFFRNNNTLYFKDDDYRNINYGRKESLDCSEQGEKVKGLQLTYDGTDFYYVSCNLTKELNK